MKKAYIAKNATEAHTICMALESAGIEAIVQGEHLGSLAGGIQTVYPEVWIRNDEDMQRADKVLAEFATAAPQVTEEDIESAADIEVNESESVQRPDSTVVRRIIVVIAIVAVVIFFVIAMRDPREGGGRGAPRGRMIGF